MRPPTWEKYVARLCLEAWALEPASLIKVVADLEALAAFGHVTDEAVATVLRMAGVAHHEADIIAPSICAAIHATQESRSDVES